MTGDQSVHARIRKFKIVFMGTPQFAVPCLQALLDGPDDVVAVVTRPDRPVGRGRKPASPPVKDVAVAVGIPVFQPERLPEIRSALEELAPDFLVVVAYGKILRPWLLQLPGIAPLNVHASLLPDLRGAAPIQWAIVRGYRETGVSIMKMDEGMDTGPVLLRRTEAIRADDDSESLGERLSGVGAVALMEALDKFRAALAGDGGGQGGQGGQMGKGERGNILDYLYARGVAFEPQDERAATIAPVISKEDGHILWTLMPAELDCFVRGLSPWPGAFTHDSIGRVIRVLGVQPAEQAKIGEAAPGTVLRVDSKQGLVVACGPQGEDAVVLTRVQPQGGKPMDGGAFARGNAPAVGSVLF